MSSSAQPKILEGPPASGKSTEVFAVLKQALTSHDWSVRLLVPSATMAEHVRNQLAREGLVLRKDTVSTLTRFVDQLALSHPGPTPTQLESAIAEVLEKRCPSEYEAVASSPGFRRHLASSADSLSLAGVHPSQLEGPLGDVYGRLLGLLQSRELALRGTRLSQTTERIELAHLLGTSHVLLDGFFSFSKTEEALLAKLSSLTRVTMTRPSRSTPEQIPLRQPLIEVLAAEDQAHEAMSIAASILRLATEGVELRRIGILLRNPGAYAPLIESTLARLEIPSRSYLGTPLVQHPVVVFHRSMVRAIESDWENLEVLSALRWRSTGLGGTPAGDSLEFRVREELPSHSIELFPQLEPFADWPSRLFTPLEAAAALKQLASLLEPPCKLEPTLEVAWVWHQRALALKSLHECLDSTAHELHAERSFKLEDFWQLLEVNLSATTLHERDTRRNVVHVMDLFESRQWDLDYIFAPGLSEGEFPQRFSPDPLLTENLKKTFGLKTLEDRNNEEHFLYEMLLTRAAKSLVILYPMINSKGDPVLPSVLLSKTPKAADPVSITIPMAAWLESTGQLTAGYRPNRVWSASEFESYLNCPWKHFAARGLELKALPELPVQRLNALLLGNVAHDAIRIWTQDPSQDIEAIADRQLERACRAERVPMGYQYERERINLLRNLRIYAKYAPPIPAGWQTQLEKPFRISLEDGLEVRGQIDRYDQSPSGEIHAYDYKYSKSKDLDEKYPIQGALYAVALGEDVSRFSFIAIREQAKATVLEADTLKNSISLAKSMITSIVKDVQAGKNLANPRTPQNCEYCEFIDACRIRTRQVVEQDAVLNSEAAEA